MASRRGSNSRAVAAKAAQDAIFQLLENNRAERRQKALLEEQNRYRLEQQKADSELRLSEKQAAHGLDLERMELQKTFDIEKENRALGAKMDAAPAALMGATQADSLNKLPTEMSLIQTARQTPGIPKSPYYGDNFAPPVVAGQARIAQPVPVAGEAPDVITDALRSRTSTEQMLKQLEQQKLMDEFNKTPRVQQTPGGLAMGINRPDTGEVAQTGLNPVQQGQRESTITRGTISAKAAEAGALEEAKWMARLKHDPSLAPGGGGDATGAEQKVASLAAAMMGSHATAMEFEKEGVGLPFGISAAGESPAWGKVAQALPSFMPGAVDEDQLNYYQAASAFTNLEGLRLSGVTVRADERQNFLATMFALSSDPDSTRKQKQEYRTRLLESLQLSLGGAADMAGTIIGQQIAQGKLPGTILNQLDFSPAMKQAILKQIPVK